MSLNSIGGFRNETVFVLTGLDIEAKAELVRRQLEHGVAVKPAELEWTLARTDHPDADTEEAASALLRCVVRDPDDPDQRRPATSPRPQSNWRWPAIRGSPSPRRRATVRSTACSPPRYVAASAVSAIAVHRRRRHGSDPAALSRPWR